MVSFLSHGEKSMLLWTPSQKFVATPMGVSLVTLAFRPHVFLQKNDMQLLVITSAAVNRFSEFVDWQIPKKL